MENFRKKTGFSIVELIIVVGTLAAIFAGAIVIFDPAKRMGQANDVKRWQDIIKIAHAIELYAIENHELPSDFATSTLSVGQKFVLCDSPGVLTCGGQTTSCLVVSDSSFLGTVLAQLPVDPQKNSTADTGYYVTRTSTGSVAVGACNSYDAAVSIEQPAKASLPPVISECGDGFVDSDEVCDDGNTYREKCGDGIVQNGTYCDNDCGSVLVMTEVCDYSGWTNDCEEGGIEYTTDDSGNYEWCRVGCQEGNDSCSLIPELP